MKLISLLLIASTASAFGVSPNPAVTKSTLSTSSVVKPAFSKNTGAAASPLFRDPTTIRGGAVPGWASYNKALDDSPLTAKACTSLVGWALGDVLAQVSKTFKDYTTVVLVPIYIFQFNIYGIRTAAHCKQSCNRHV